MFVNFHQFILPFIGTLIICMIGGLLSPLIVFKQRSYLSDTLAHLIFPGVVAGLFVSQMFHFDSWVCIISGAFVSAIFGTYLSEWFLTKLKIPPDAAAIVCLSGFFAFGIIWSALTKQELIDPEELLFGDILALTYSNLFVLFFVLICVLSVMIIYRNHWSAWLTDPEFAQIVGFKIKLLDKLFPILVTVSVLAGFLAVGGLMISALMTIPAVLYQSRDLISIQTILLSVVLGLIGFLLAIFLNLPIGPILVLIGFIAIAFKAFLRGFYVRQSF